MMEHKRFELIVGLFMVGVLVVLGIMTIQLGKLKLYSKPTYTIYGLFNDVSGLYKNSRIRIAGVNVGYVYKIGLKNGKAFVDMKVEKEYKIPINSVAIVKSEGFLGEKFIEIKMGNASKYIESDGYIKSTTSEGFNELMARANNVLNKQNRQNLGDILKEFKKLGMQLNAVVASNRNNLKETIQQAKLAMEEFKNAMKSIQMVVRENQTNAKEAIKQAKLAMEKLNQTIENAYLISSNLKEGKGTLGQLLTNQQLYSNLNSASENINQIAGKINSGKGTIGKLVNNNEIYNNLNETLVDIKNYLQKANKTLFEIYANTEYQFNGSNLQSAAGVKIYTSPDRFYQIGIVDQKNYQHFDHPSGNNSDIVRYTALMGKRYYNFGIKVGVIQSTVGFGTDYYILNDKLKFGAELFDFAHTNNKRDTHPQMRFKVSYTFLRHFTLFGGVNEILNNESRSLFLGVGMKLYDNDLKYALAGASSASGFIK